MDWQQNRDSAERDISGQAHESGDRANPKAEEVLLSDITQWREQIARSIARNNYAMRSGEIVTAVNQIIFALLFTRIAEDRALIKAGTLEKILAADDRCTACHSASQKIAAGWGCQSDSDPDKNFPGEYPVIEDRVLIPILSSLCSTERPYNFATIPTEAIAQVFDQYLERTIRRSATHQVIVIDTHTTIQSGEIQYPAPAVIDYLVYSTLDSAFNSRSDQEFLPIRVLDPVCGAGATLLRAYGYLIDATGPVNISFAEKKEILLNSIHGVDTDRQCITAAKLLLIIKLLEDEHAESLPGDFFTVCEEVFRGLRHTLQVGNSVIGPEIMNDELWPFFPSPGHQSIKPFEWKSSFPEIMVSGGFDAIIGFLPRGPIGSDHLIQHYFQRQYAVYHPLADRSGYFIERGLSLLRRNGKLGFITNDQWLRRKNDSLLRRALRMNRIEEIVLFGKSPGTRIHPAKCIVRVANCSPADTFFVTLISQSPKESIADFILHHRFAINSATLDDGGWIFRDTRGEDIIVKMRKSGIPLEEFVMGQVYEGIEIGSDKPFLINKKVKEQLVGENPECESLIRPFITGKGIARYQITSNPKYLVYPRGGPANNETSSAGLYQRLKRRHPSTARSGKSSMKNIEVPGRVGDTRGGMLNDKDFWKGTNPKIFFRNRFKNPGFAFDEGWTIADNTTNAIASSNRYLLGLLNSRLIAFLFKNSHLTSGAEQKLHSWDDLRNLPLYSIDFDDPVDKIRHERMVILVSEMLSLHKHMSLAKIDREKHLITREIESIDRQIDSLVYGLYGLTADEIAVVEESVTK
jgi:hypothetical protein